ncbi:hypothetical protein [Sphingosinicella sp.]|uniref:hypothetical protein n=1 Tax=Sphingosinicella sp. TaxID=1917971 RepID=UPI00263A0D74|nr:hypothetical protein [Sphingosinicella sp.]
MAKRKIGFLEMRSVLRAEDVKQLKPDPCDQDAKLDIERGESSPASDLHSRMQPEHD